MSGEEADASLGRLGDYLRVGLYSCFRIRLRNAIGTQLGWSFLRDWRWSIAGKEKAGLRAQDEQAGSE